MKYSELHGGELRNTSQELDACLPGIGGQVPSVMLAAVTRLSGGYKNLAGSSYVEISEDRVACSVYWTDGEVFGEVAGSSDDWSAARGPSNLRLTGRVVPVRQLSRVEFADKPTIVRDPFDQATIQFNDGIRLVFADGTDLSVPQLPGPLNSQQRTGLDKFIEAVLAVVRSDRTLEL